MDLFTFLILLYISVLLIVAAVFLYFGFFSKGKQETESNQQQVYKKSKKILIDAHKKARSMLRVTAEKAARIMAQSQTLNHEIHQDFDNTLQHVANQNLGEFNHESHELLDDYHTSLEGLKNNYIEQLHQVVEDIKNSSESELKDYRQTLKKETLDAQEVVGQKINEEFAAAQKEISEYKQKKLQKIDESIQKMVSEYAKKIFRKSIPLEDHEQLILEALEEAKKKGVFQDESGSTSV